jgi:hypothetical protein
VLRMQFLILMLWSSQKLDSHKYIEKGRILEVRIKDIAFDYKGFSCQLTPIEESSYLWVTRLFTFPGVTFQFPYRVGAPELPHPGPAFVLGPPEAAPPALARSGAAPNH